MKGLISLLAVLLLAAGAGSRPPHPARPGWRKRRCGPPSPPRGRGLGSGREGECRHKCRNSRARAERPRYAWGGRAALKHIDGIKSTGVIAATVKKRRVLQLSSLLIVVSLLPAARTAPGNKGRRGLSPA
jgi:hypothetical protein